MITWLCFPPDTFDLSTVVVSPLLHLLIVVCYISPWPFRSIITTVQCATTTVMSLCRSSSLFSACLNRLTLSETSTSLIIWQDNKRMHASWRAQSTVTHFELKKSCFLCNLIVLRRLRETQRDWKRQSLCCIHVNTTQQKIEFACKESHLKMSWTNLTNPCACVKISDSLRHL